MVNFSKKHRLASKRDFQSVFDHKPCKISQKNLLALYRTNSLSHARLGILIGKHVIKQAVDRNQLRRIIRESFRHHKDALKGLDIIILIRSECTPLDKRVTRANTDKLWQRLINLLETS